MRGRTREETTASSLLLLLSQRGTSLSSQLLELMLPPPQDTESQDQLSSKAYLPRPNTQCVLSKQVKRAEAMAQLVEDLPSMHKTPDSTPSTP